MLIAFQGPRLGGVTYDLLTRGLGGAVCLPRACGSQPNVAQASKGFGLGVWVVLSTQSSMLVRIGAHHQGFQGVGILLLCFWIVGTLD